MILLSKLCGLPRHERGQNLNMPGSRFYAFPAVLWWKGTQKRRWAKKYRKTIESNRL